MAAKRTGDDKVTTKPKDLRASALCFLDDVLKSLDSQLIRWTPKCGNAPPYQWQCPVAWLQKRLPPASNGCRSQATQNPHSCDSEDFGTFTQHDQSRLVCRCYRVQWNLKRICAHKNFFPQNLSFWMGLRIFFGLDNGSNTYLHHQLAPKSQVNSFWWGPFCSAPPLALAIAMGAAATTTKRAAIEVSCTDSDSEYQRIIKGYKLLLCTLMQKNEIYIIYMHIYIQYAWFYVYIYLKGLSDYPQLKNR